MVVAKTALKFKRSNDKTHGAAWYTLWVLVLAALFSVVDREILALLTDPVSKSLGLHDSQIGFIQGMGSATFAMVATYPLGWLTDRVDRRLVLSGCILAWAVGTAGCGLSGNFWGLFAAVLAISAGEAGLPSLSYSAIPDLFEGRQRITANQIFYVAIMLSSAAGMMIGGGASAALDSVRAFLPAALHGIDSWRLLFVLVAAPAPLVVLLVVTTKLGSRPAPASALTATRTEDAALIPYLRKHGAAAAIVIAALCVYGLPFGAVLAWAPAALARLFGVTPAENGLGLGVGLAIGCGVGVGSAMWMMRRFTPSLGSRTPLRIARYVLLASLPAGLLFMFVTNAWQAFVLIGLQMTTGTLIGSLHPDIVQGLAPPALRGRITALYNIISAITAGLGVSLVGPLSDLMPRNPRGLLVAMSALVIVSWSVGAFLMKLAERPFERTLRALGDVHLDQTPEVELNRVMPFEILATSSD